MSNEKEMDDVLAHLRGMLDDMPDPPEESLRMAEELMGRFLLVLDEVKNDVDVPTVLSMLSKLICTIAYAQGVSFQKFQLGMAMAYAIVAETAEQEDNLTQSQSVH